MTHAAWELILPWGQMLSMGAGLIRMVFGISKTHTEFIMR